MSGSDVFYFEVNDEIVDERFALAAGRITEYPESGDGFQAAYTSAVKKIVSQCESVLKGNIARAEAAGIYLAEFEPEAYTVSFMNPEYVHRTCADTVFCECELPELLAAWQMELAGAVPLTAEGRKRDAANILETQIQIMNVLAEPDPGTGLFESIKDIIYSYVYDYTEEYVTEYAADAKRMTVRQHNAGIKKGAAGYGEKTETGEDGATDESEASGIYVTADIGEASGRRKTADESGSPEKNGRGMTGTEDVLLNMHLINRLPEQGCHAKPYFSINRKAALDHGGDLKFFWGTKLMRHKLDSLKKAGILGAEQNGEMKAAEVTGEVGMSAAVTGAALSDAAVNGLAEAGKYTAYQLQLIREYLDSRYQA